MNEIMSILESIPYNVPTHIVFNSGMEMELADFEMVDESIYGNDYTCLSNVVKQIVCDKRFFTPGTKMEFSVLDVTEIWDVKEKTVLFSSSGK